MDIKKRKQAAPDWLKPIWDSIEHYYSPETCKVVESGSFAVCPREPYQIGETWWVHVIGRPVPEEALINIEVDLGWRYFNHPDAMVRPLVELTGGYDFDHFVPDKFIQLLRQFNGVQLFGGHLSISGVMSISCEQADTIHGDLPVCEGELTRFNIYDRSKNIQPRILVIAGYGSNGSLVYLKAGTETVYCCNLLGDILKTWPSIEIWIKVEVDRLSRHFDDAGNYIASMGPTHPS